ncbi:MAG: hypothetical protein O3C57_04885, partial [Verrucomicrobia bacterium]|nr:hypothetical protein [Verrucomicrobiota bacterium]
MPTYHSFTGKGILRASVCVICTCMFTACETLVQEQQVHESAQIRTEIVNLQVQVQRLSSRLD